MKAPQTGTNVDEHQNRDGATKTILVSLLLGICVFCIAYLTAWREVGSSPYVSTYRIHTMSTLLRAWDAIEEYREDTGVLPDTLEEAVVGRESKLGTVRNGHVLDTWGNPITYSQTVGGFMVCSYGRDGRPGGRGMDGDLCADRPNGAERRSLDACFPTLTQFAFELNTKGILAACIASGVLAMGTWLFGWRQSPPPKSVGAGLLRILATLVVSLFTAAILVVLYMPKGH